MARLADAFCPRAAADIIKKVSLFFRKGSATFLTLKQHISHNEREDRVRALKILVTIVATVVCIFSMAAVASAATNGFAEGQYTALLEGKPSSTPWINLDGVTPTCEGGGFEAGRTGPATNLPTIVSGLNCWEFGHSEAIAMNGCQFIFHPGAETSAGTFAGTMEIGPTNCGPMSYKAWEACQITWPSQAGLGATFTNLSGGKVEIKVNAEHVKYAECGKGREDGTWKQTWIVSARTTTGVAQSVQVEDLSIGLSVGESAKLVGQRYPLTALGAQVEPFNLAFSSSELTEMCRTANFRSTGISEETASMQLAPSFGEECESGEHLAGGAIVPHSCSLTLHLTSNTSGTFGVSCETPGDTINVSGAALCTFKIGAQSGLGTVSFSNVNLGGSENYVKAAFAVTGITYTSSGKNSCPTKGQTFSNGTLKGTIYLRGYELGFLG